MRAFENDNEGTTLKPETLAHQFQAQQEITAWWRWKYLNANNNPS